LKERILVATVQQNTGQSGYTASGEAQSVRDAYDAMLKGGKR
jgi:hypothetical protein